MLVLRSLLISICMVSRMLGADYFVSPTGSNLDDGSFDHPWRTLQFAADHVAAGDSVTVMPGTYAERVVVQVSGLEGQPIIFRAQTTGTAILDGSSVMLPEWGGLFEISGQSHVVIQGLRVTHAGPTLNSAGVLVQFCSQVTVDSVETYQTVSSGIAIWDSDQVVVSHNDVELACNDGEQECITVAGTSHFEVRGNHVHHGGPGSHGGEGIDIKDGSSYGLVYQNDVYQLNRLGIYVDSWDKHTHHIEVFENVVHANQSDGIVLAAEAGGLLEQIHVYNNLAYDNSYSGIVVAGWGEPVPTHPIQDCFIINNTCVNNGGSTWGGGIVVENPDADRITVRNNIFSENVYFQILVEDVGVDMVVDFNLIDGFRGEPGEIRGDEYREGDPGFVDPNVHDYHLAEGSLAIDGGTLEMAPDVDFDGVSRNHGAAPDMGAYEFGTPSQVIFADDFESGDTSAWSFSATSMASPMTSH